MQEQHVNRKNDRATVHHASIDLNSRTAKQSRKRGFKQSIAIVLGITAICVPVIGFAAELTSTATAPAIVVTPTESAASAIVTQPSEAKPETGNATKQSDAIVAPEAVVVPLAPKFVMLDGFEVQLEKRTIAIPFRSSMRMSSDVATGQVQSSASGQNGVREKEFKVFYKNGNAVKSELVYDKVVKAPVDRITVCGIRVREARALPSRSGSYDRIRELDMVATGYAPWEGSGAGRCATGMRAGYGVVAVDPRVIPLGSRLYVEGYGYAIAGDTGGAIKHNRIDLGHNTYSEAEGVGRRHVHVYVLGLAR